MKRGIESKLVFESSVISNRTKTDIIRCAICFLFESSVISNRTKTIISKVCIVPTFESSVISNRTKTRGYESFYSHMFESSVISNRTKTTAATKDAYNRFESSVISNRTKTHNSVIFIGKLENCHTIAKNGSSLVLFRIANINSAYIARQALTGFRLWTKRYFLQIVAPFSKVCYDR